jgi:hypothetical protein
MSPRHSVRKHRTIVGLLAAALAHAEARADQQAEPPPDEQPDAPVERTSSLSWVRLEGADGCLSASSLAGSVEKRLDRKVFFSASEADLNIEGSIGPRSDGPGFRATLRLTTREGESLGMREVESQSPECGAIDEQLAIVVSLMIDPNATAAPEPEPPPPPAPKTKVVEKKIVREKVVEKERVVVVPAEPREPIHWEISAAFMGTLGLQPDVGWGIAPAFVIEITDLFAILAEGGIAAKTSAEAENDRVAADAAFMHGALALCPLIAHPDRFTIMGCAGWLVGGVLSSGDGFDLNRDATPIITGPWLEGRFSVRIVGPVGLVSSIGLVVPITRAELYYETPAGQETLHETFPVAGLLDLGINVRLP